jgi:hypothetical protein
VSVTCRSIRNAWLTCGNGRSAGAGEDLNGAGGDPAVTGVGGGVRDRHLSPRQGIQGVEEGSPVLLDRKHELTATLMDMVRGGLDRVQRVRGHDLVVQVDTVEHHRRHRVG